MTSNWEDSPFGPMGGTSGPKTTESGLANPFSDEKVTVSDVKEYGREGDFVQQVLAEELAKYKIGKVSQVAQQLATTATSAVTAVVRELWEGVRMIVTQAVKMALFKFAIEACAMAIKRLVEMMTGMNLVPPNIDTKGVFYNFSTSTTQAPPSQTTSSGPSRYDNPFGNSPFGTSPTW